jgi:hypothetical protein
MAMGKWVILFTFLLSYTMFIFMGYDTTFTKLISCFQDPGSPVYGTATSCNLGGFNLFMDLKTILLGLAGLGLAGALGLSALGSITAGTIKFPDPYTLFGLASMFLFGFFTFPVDLFNQAGNVIPGEFKILVVGYYSIAYILSFFEFGSKGSL